MKNWSATDYMNITKELETAFGANDTSSIYGLSAYAHAVEETDYDIPTPVKGTRHPSTRGERRKATAHKKNRQKALKRNLGYSERWVNNPSFRHTTYSSDPLRGTERMKGKKAIRNWRAEYGDRNVFVRNASTWRYWEDDADFLYNLRVWNEDEVWQEAWSERAEEEYWERVEAEEWEEMSTFKEVEEFYAEEIEVEELPDDGEEWTEVCGLERDDDLSSVGCKGPDFAVTCDGMTFTADSEKGAAWLYDRLFAFYGDRVKFDVIFSPVVPSKWDCVYTIMVEGHTFTVVGDEGFRWLHRKLRAFYDVEFNLHIVY